MKGAHYSLPLDLKEAWRVAAQVNESEPLVRLGWLDGRALFTADVDRAVLAARVNLAMAALREAGPEAT